MSTAIFWFRQDLRCNDNPALTMAVNNHKKLIAVYIREPESVISMGRAQQWWLHHSLTSLKNNLNKVKLDLHFSQGDPLELLKGLITRYSVDAVYWNRCYEPVYRSRDELIKTELNALGVTVVNCNGSLLNEPADVLNQNGTYFKVFTPYWRSCLRQMQLRPVGHITEWPMNQSISSLSLDTYNLLPKNPDWAKEFGNYWQPGEKGASNLLQKFIKNHLCNYKKERDEPAKSGTSRLSPHLHFGEISPQQIWIAIQQVMQDPNCDLDSVHTYLAELGWREFSYYLLYHYPELARLNFKSQFDNFPWQDDEKLLKLWQKGLTGYPIVDAGMRELWHTGYMHNRVRMIVASFLTKDLMIDWRKGAEWFWDTLLDADLANNSTGWQWVAGSGPDAAPYFRIFNPVIQSEKFDPQGEYIRRWVPELASVAQPWIHKPWMAPKNALPLVLGVDYPLPVVEHDKARQIALSLYKQLKQ